MRIKTPKIERHGAISDVTVLGDGTLGVDWDKVETDPDGSSVGFSDPGVSEHRGSFHRKHVSGEFK